jgi:8-oxo-dGTP diphosphatase
MINFINDYPISYIEKVKNSVIVKGTSDRNWIYISSEAAEELNIIKGKLKRNDNLFAVIEDWMIPILTKGSQIKWKLSTVRVFLPINTVLLASKYAVFDLKIGDAESIYENSDYKEFISIEYIRDRIQKGLSSGIYDAGKLVAWGITQDDGAIGFLHVLPEYRLRGYGRDIIINLIKKVRKQGKLPFANIEEKNEKSMNLVISLGFRKDRIVNWLEIE